ncbi:MAG: YIP1 family protein [Pikeienuella sp.]
MTSETVEDLPEVHLEDVQQPLEPLTGMSVWARIRLSYRDMRHTTRALIEEEPSEARLLFFVLLSDVIFFLSFGVRLIVSPSQVVSEYLPVPAQLGTALLGIFLVRTLALYIFSAIVCLVGRALGGRASWRDSRAAIFWASLVAAPIGVLGAIIGAAFSHLEPIYPIFASSLLAWPPILIGIVAFVFFLSAGVAEAHRFRKTSPVFITFSVLTLVLLVVVLIAGQSLMDTLGLTV